MGEIRFVGTGETRGYPYPLCKKISSNMPVTLNFAFSVIKGHQTRVALFGRKYVMLRIQLLLRMSTNKATV